MATSVWAFRRVWLNSANFEQRPKAFVRRIFRWGVQLGLDCWVGRGWEGRGCLEGALDLLTGVDVMARGRAPRGALRVFCEEILFITLVGDRHFGAPLCFPHPGTCHERSKDVRIHRARKIFSVPVAEFFGPSQGAIFLVAFSFILVAIVRQDSKVQAQRKKLSLRVASAHNPEHKHHQ